MLNNFDKILKYLIIFLTFMFIFIYLLKKFMNYDGIHRYNLIDRNTIGYWLLISISLFLSKFFFNNYLYTIIIIIIIVIIHETLWYSIPILNISNLSFNFLKDEAEITNNWYSWANNFCGTDANLSNGINNISNGVDFSEGIFDNKWNISDKESYKLKYETYFDYLKLKPGMKLLDIGCGNGHWMFFCKERGIECTGITISIKNKEECIKNGINKIILGDIHKNILLTINEKFDAVSAIGPVEHFSSISEPQVDRINKLNTFYNQVKKLIDPNSSSKRFLNSIMQTNINYSHYQSFDFYFNIYIIASVFGYGYYPLLGEMEKIYNSKDSKIIIKRDYTEDYRWIMIRNPNSIGFCKYRINSFNNFINIIKDIIFDPAWIHRLVYGHSNAWLWQFGGTNSKPIPYNKDTPIRSFIYVTYIN